MQDAPIMDHQRGFTVAVLVVGLSTAADQLLWGVPTRCGGSIDDQGQKLSYALTCLENRRAEEVPYFYQPDPSFYPNDWVNCSKYIDKDMRYRLLISCMTIVTFFHHPYTQRIGPHRAFQILFNMTRGFHTTIQTSTLAKSALMQ